MSDHEEVYNQALKYLNKKMYARGDLRVKLSRKNSDLMIVDEVLDQLTNEGLLDDKKYAEIYLQNMLSYKTYGFYLIKQKLLQKRLEKSLVEALLRKHLDEDTEKEIARRLIQKKTQTGKSKEQMAYSLRQKGFRTSVALAAIQEKKII